MSLTGSSVLADSYLEVLKRIMIINDLNASATEGDLFNLTSAASLDLGDQINLLVENTGDIPVSVIGNVEGSFAMQINIYKGTTFTNKGTPVTYFNRNLTSSKTSDIRLYFNPVITDDGLSFFYKILGGGRSGSNTSEALPWILNPADYYLVRVVSNANGNNVNFAFDWHNS